jgi:hypothetical protein
MTGAIIVDYESFTNRWLAADMNRVRGRPAGSGGALFANTDKGPTKR